MELIRRAGTFPERLAVFPGTFNPPTRAHLALAEAALQVAGEVLFVLPQVFPHKEWRGVSFQNRLSLLEAAVAPYSRFSLASATGGLFIDIAREARAHYPGGTELLFLCGRDAAERIVNWDYGDSEAFPRMLREFALLVARRGQDYTPPEHLADRIHSLPVGPECDDVSATVVREKLAAGASWQHLVPPHITRSVAALYGR